MGDSVLKNKVLKFISFLTYFIFLIFLISFGLFIYVLIEESLKTHVKFIFTGYIALCVVFLLFLYFMMKYEKKLLMFVLNSYEIKNRYKTERLRDLNKNLKKEVNKKTKEMLKGYFTDVLTGLPNREKLLTDWEGNKYIAILNIDSFKEINNFYGMRAGDEILKQAGLFLAEYANTYKLAADEFAFLDNDFEHLHESVKKAVEDIEKKEFAVNNSKIGITISAGIADSITKADMALKHIKNTKDSKICVFSPFLPIVKEYENNLKWKNIIKYAVNNDKVTPYIQPLINSKTLKADKYECLIRIEYENEIISPFYFLNVAKKTGQYFQLQKIMIEKCFKKFAEYDYKFSINLAASELSNNQFKKFLIEKIDEYDVSEKLIIELLEDEAVLNEELIGFLIFLSTIGVEFAMDDFGSGYSNLSYLLTKLPIQILKIDGSLIKNIDVDKKNYRLVKALIKLAKMFNLSVVAEYAENENIVSILKKLEIDYFQGYYFGKPFSIDKL